MFISDYRKVKRLRTIQAQISKIDEKLKEYQCPKLDMPGVDLLSLGYTLGRLMRGTVFPRDINLRDYGIDKDNEAQFYCFLKDLGQYLVDFADTEREMCTLIKCCASLEAQVEELKKDLGIY